MKKTCLFLSFVCLLIFLSPLPGESAVRTGNLDLFTPSLDGPALVLNNQKGEMTKEEALQIIEDARTALEKAGITKEQWLAMSNAKRISTCYAVLGNAGTQQLQEALYCMGLDFVDIFL